MREYVPRFAEITEPLTELLNIKTKFRRGEDAELAFNNLKQPMSRPLQLHRPDVTRRFYLQTDASGISIASVLYQEEDGRKQVISYASAKLTPHKDDSTSLSKNVWQSSGQCNGSEHTWR